MQGSGEQMEEGEDKEWKELGIDYCLTSVNASLVLMLNRLMSRVCRIMEYFESITLVLRKVYIFKVKYFPFKYLETKKKKRK